MSRYATKLLAVTAATLLFVGAAPDAFDIWGSRPALAQGNSDNGNGGGNSGGNGGGNSGDNGGGNSGGGGNAGGNGGGAGNGGGNGGGQASANAGSSARGKSASAPGQTKSSGATSSASLKPAAAPSANQGKPKAVVRQYVIENGLKQGDVAKLLKSWNSLNRNSQAYLANLDNPKSLPGLQLAYVQANLTAKASLATFTGLGGDPSNPPTAADLLAAQNALAAQEALDAQAVLDDPLATDLEQEAAQAIVDAYAGADPEAVVEAFDAAYDFDAQTIIDQYNAFAAYQAAEADAQDAFMAASVSYKGTYSDATFGELRSLVDAIVAKKGLDTLATP